MPRGATLVARGKGKAPAVVPAKIQVKKDDVVRVIAGRDSGKTGRVLEVQREKGKVLVEHVSMVKRHTRPNPQRQIKGGVAERESPIHVSNVMVVCPGCNKPTRIGHKQEGDRSSRVCRHCGASLERKR